MALTRKGLKAMGLTEEQIDSIIEGHTETVDGLKGEIEALKAEGGKVKELEEKLKSFEGGEDWKAKFDQAKKELEDYKADVAAKEEAGRVKDAYRELLKGANVDPKRYDVILRATDLKGEKLDREGKLKNAEALTEAIKKDWGDFIVTEGKKGAEVQTPPSGAGARLTRAEIYARDERGHYKMGAAERQQALIDNNLL